MKRNIGILKIHSESSKDSKAILLLLPLAAFRAPGCGGEKQVTRALYKHALKWFGDVTSDLHNPFFNFSYPSLSSKAQGIANGKGIIISESYPGNRLSSASFRFVSDGGLLGCGGGNGCGEKTRKNVVEPPTGPGCTKIIGHFEVIEKITREPPLSSENL